MSYILHFLVLDNSTGTFCALDENLLNYIQKGIVTEISTW